MSLDAKTLGLDPQSFATCLAGQMADKVREDAINAGALGIAGTPSFLVGAVQTDGRVKVAKRLAGALPVARFQEVLDLVLASSGQVRR